MIQIQKSQNTTMNRTKLKIIELSRNVERHLWKTERFLCGLKSTGKAFLKGSLRIRIHARTKSQQFSTPKHMEGCVSLCPHNMTNTVQLVKFYNFKPK
jgi:hypothetical protein